MLLSTDPVARRLTVDGDIDTSSGRAVLIAGVEGFAAGARARLELLRGELFYDRTRGVPYLENDHVAPADALLGQPFDEGKLRRAYESAIMDTPGAQRMIRFEVSFNGRARKATVTWQARTVFGDTPVIATPVEF